MPVIKIDLGTETFRRLIALATAERRPIQWQAEVLLRHVLAGPVGDAALRESAPKEASAVAGSELVGAVGESHA
jgi:hypothetical protein